jgi:hypothetical protein
MQEINQTVDHAGLTELLKLTMIDYVLKLMDNLLLLYQLLILLHVVDSSNVSVWDVMEDKLELHGPGSKIPELFQEEISVIKLLVIHIPCQNVEITMVTLLAILNVKMLLKFHQNAELLVLETVLTITTINIKLHHLIH